VKNHRSRRALEKIGSVLQEGIDAESRVVYRIDRASFANE
jgi:hypothetical protein